MAMVIMEEEQPDICMIETGMGGRYDATNVIMSEGQRDHINQRRSYGIPWTNDRRDRNTQGRDH